MIFFLIVFITLLTFLRFRSSIWWWFLATTLITTIMREIYLRNIRKNLIIPIFEEPLLANVGRSSFIFILFLPLLPRCCLFSTRSRCVDCKRWQKSWSFYRRIFLGIRIVWFTILLVRDGSIKCLRCSVQSNTRFASKRLEKTKRNGTFFTWLIQLL